MCQVCPINEFSYSEEEDDAVEDGHGDSNCQRLTFGDTYVELWHLTWADIAAEEEGNLPWVVHGEAADWELERHYREKDKIP